MYPCQRRERVSFNSAGGVQAWRNFRNDVGTRGGIQLQSLDRWFASVQDEA
ncbi:hypothetical protein TRAPUB_699 [Trametes pubescens]|uniref:Uncharacterized protein n=1 Tax=Trametes pubescens TaxID=154538 RepID=A0A1M2VLB5_TRAPU|nr:hypothetical protein TRAPUB_699 [Trametes pubescens]